MHAKLVKFYPFHPDTACKEANFQHSQIKCDLENGSRVTKLYLFQNQLISSEEIVQTSHFEHSKTSSGLNLRLRSLKFNQLFFFTYYCSCVSFVKIYPFTQEIDCRKKPMPTPTGSATKSICPLPPSGCRGKYKKNLSSYDAHSPNTTDSQSIRKNSKYEADEPDIRK